ncbi:hypothetical protein BCR41DRAFT_370562 [Lobosporangium transversale]|uniref:Zn(2)-C6 fungal-type domain-containing protein n=1 Tax=Lobosporangium transversale TaxID=64571 RepID=A0A1Y2GNP9_9FUNG|nr:hypothetical protein BCR41DRAFT_370562 [Lobosporangium transversale]ORZ16802.1 hypothetical protein BCR41DRAFT_370562 [Lobosporangium transversale]|eukprot:XP_021881737.1 hypothetical protein BCR41DRAFT_370562 [Lobosporangium transversale]
MSNTIVLESTPTSMAPSVTLSYAVAQQQGPLDGLDTTMAALHGLGLGLTSPYNTLKQEHLTPIFSSASPSSTLTSPLDLSERFGSFQSHPSQVELKEIFSPHELNLDFVSSSTSLGSVPGPCQPSPLETCRGQSVFPIPTPGSTMSQVVSDFEHIPETLSLSTDMNTDMNTNKGSTLNLSLNTPTLANMIDAPSPSPSSTPPSSNPPSPTSPSYDDIMTPVVACASCKKSHIKCDHGRPCQNCLKHPSKASSCQDAVPKPRGRPKGGSKAAAAEATVGSNRGVYHLHHPHQYSGFHLVPGPYQYMRGVSEHSQLYRQRAMSFPHISFVHDPHEPSPCILQSQQQHQHQHQHQPQPQPQPQHQQQRPDTLQQHSLHYHPYQHAQPQHPQMSQFHQRAVSHPQTRYSTPEGHSPSAVDFQRLSPGHPSPVPSSPYSWEPLTFSE